VITVGRLSALALAASLVAPVESLDGQLQRRVQAGRSPALDRVAETVMDVTKPQVVFGGLLLVAAFGGPAGPAIARHALYALVPANVVVEVTKRAVDRHRPEGEHKRSNASFPSSHAANAAALAWVLGWHWRRAAPFLALFALAVAAARVYLNRHFASDVLVGVIVGLASGWLVTRTLGRRSVAGARTGRRAA
jgi:undecaprenyl-diphosphatase